VIWYGKPVLGALMFKSLVLLVIGLPSFITPVFILESTGSINPETFYTLALFFIFWYCMAGLLTVSPIIHTFLSWRNTLYILTDERIIVRRRAVGIDYRILDLDNVQQVNLDVGFWDNNRSFSRSWASNAISGSGTRKYSKTNKKNR